MKILVTGGTGMVGNSLVRDLPEAIYVSSSDVDLTNKNATMGFISEHRPDAVIHLAAKVGGIKDNSDYLYEYYMDNMAINMNVIHACRREGVRKLIALSSSCVYPAKPPAMPITEDMLHEGYPEKTNCGYAFAKRMMQVQMDLIRKKNPSYRWNIVYPSNLYGPYDTFDLQRSHVIPALILKFHQAKIDYQKNVELYGTGQALRQFTYVDDLAKRLVEILDADIEGDYNFACPDNYRIHDIAQLIQHIVGHEGNIVYTGELDGVMNKEISNSKIEKVFPTPFKFVPIEEGIRNTYQWFLENKV